MREGPFVRDNPEPSEGLEVAGWDGTTGVKLDRGIRRFADEPAIVGPMANGPLAVISATCLPSPRPRPRPLPRGDADNSVAVGSYGKKICI
jgi:hypothetical protein